MNRIPFGALAKSHRLALSLVGIVAASAVILPACGGGGDGTSGPNAPVTMTIAPPTGTVLVGATLQYSIVVRDQGAMILPAFTTATWSIVGSPGIATIAPAGGLATCVTAGTVTVHAVGPANGAGVNLTADASLQCTAPVPVATTMTILVTSSPATGIVPAGATRQYAIEVRDQFNAVLTAFTTAAWSLVVTPGIATITPAGGLATCITAGTGTVHAVGPVGASGANLTADASLQCAAPIPVATTMTILVTSAPTTGTILVGASRQYAIEVRDQFNAVMTAFTTAAWSIGGTLGIATITPTGGLATCILAGTTTVHAVGPVGPSGANLAADASLQCVLPAGVPTTMTIVPATGTALVGATLQYAIQVRDQYNVVLTAFTTATWSTIGGGAGGPFATITPAGGLATCVSEGNPTVRAVGPAGPLGPNLVAEASLQCARAGPIFRGQGSSAPFALRARN